MATAGMTAAGAVVGTTGARVGVAEMCVVIETIVAGTVTVERAAPF